MIERHVTFEVLNGMADAFESFFIEKYRPAMSSMAGFVRVELLRFQESPLTYKMLIRFDSLESAAAWRASAKHQALSPDLKTMYSSSQVQVYQVVA
jgi:heme-degrading monooxygenase HmoA